MDNGSENDFDHPVNRSNDQEKGKKNKSEQPTSVPLLQLGVGSVGSELIELIEDWNRSPSSAPNYKYVGFADRSGLGVNMKGFSKREVEEIKRGKKKGKGISEISTSRLSQLDKIDSVFSTSGEGVLIDVTDAGELVEVYEKSLENNWSIVLANKVPLTEIKPEDFQRFIEAGIRYEATVGAGLPVISTLEGLKRQGDEIEEIAAILSGSLNYILSRLEEGRNFDRAVLEAKRKGLTEPNPVEDLTGNDVERKVLILSRTLGMDLSLSDIDTNPLVPITDKDYESTELEKELKSFNHRMGSSVESAHKRGKRLKYVARISDEEVRVGLEEVEGSSPLGKGESTTNVILFRTENYEDPPLVIQGPGAGPKVTAGGILSDINLIEKKVKRPQRNSY